MVSVGRNIKDHPVPRSCHGSDCTPVLGVYAEVGEGAVLCVGGVRKAVVWAGFGVCDAVVHLAGELREF